MIKTFQDLGAWREGHKLVLLVYTASNFFPKEETYGLKSQVRRAAVSITSNIAEGFSRKSYREKTQFYSISQGSVTELQNQLIIAKDVGYIDERAFAELYQQADLVHKIVHGLIKHSKVLY